MAEFVNVTLLAQVQEKLAGVLDELGLKAVGSAFMGEDRIVFKDLDGGAQHSIEIIIADRSNPLRSNWDGTHMCYYEVDAFPIGDNGWKYLLLGANEALTPFGPSQARTFQSIEKKLRRYNHERIAMLTQGLIGHSDLVGTCRELESAIRELIDGPIALDLADKTLTLSFTEEANSDTWRFTFEKRTTKLSVNDKPAGETKSWDQEDVLKMFYAAKKEFGLCRPRGFRF